MIKGKFRVRIIKAGLSLNGNYYPDAVLQKAAHLFDGVRVFVKSDQEHLTSQGKDVRNLIGRISAPEFIPSRTADQGEIVGTLELIDPDSEIGKKITRAAERGMLDLFGLSIDVTGTAEREQIKGRPVRVARTFEKVHSVDLIVEPGAGGQVVNLIEAAGISERQIMDRDQIIALIKAKRPEALQDKIPEEMTDAELSDLLGSLISGESLMTEAVVSGMRMMVNATRLPAKAKSKLIGEFATSANFTEADVRRRIAQEVDYLACAGQGGGHITGLGDETIRMGESRREKVEGMLDAFFDPKDTSVISIRECYREITGDNNFTGQLRNCDRVRLTEALGTDTFDVVLGDSISRRMIEDYKGADIYGLWRDLVTVVPVTDFRTQERVRFGGYGDLPVVAEAGPYVPMTSPTDEKATYAVSKRGGLETITLEMITNDDVGAVQRVPIRLAQAAKRTLSKFVFDIPKTNSPIFDGKALFHVDHGNLGTATLDGVSLKAARLAMKAQKEKDSDEKLGIPPKFLWVSDDLEETAFNLFARNTNLDPDFIESLNLKIRPVWCWTDANDWCISADTREIPIIELGFLQGREEPELFIQDSPTSGSMFSNDKLTFKIRHIYGAVATDYRGIYKAVVAAGV